MNELRIFFLFNCLHFLTEPCYETDDDSQTQDDVDLDGTRQPPDGRLTEKASTSQSQQRKKGKTGIKKLIKIALSP